MLELIKYKLEELERLSSSLSADIVKNNDIDNSLKIDINIQFAIIQDSITVFSTNGEIKDLINKIQNDKYVCIKKLKKEEKDIIINILKKIVNDRLKSYELETLGIQPKYI